MVQNIQNTVLKTTDYKATDLTVITNGDRRNYWSIVTLICIIILRRTYSRLAIFTSSASTVTAVSYFRPVIGTAVKENSLLSGFPKINVVLCITFRQCPTFDKTSKSKSVVSNFRFASLRPFYHHSYNPIWICPWSTRRLSVKCHANF